MVLKPTINPWPYPCLTEVPVSKTFSFGEIVMAVLEDKLTRFSQVKTASLGLRISHIFIVSSIDLVANLLLSLNIWMAVISQPG